MNKDIMYAQGEISRVRNKNLEKKARSARMK